MKYGFGPDKNVEKILTKKDYLMRMITRRQKKITLVENQIKKAIEYKNELMQWVAHSKKFTTN